MAAGDPAPEKHPGLAAPWKPGQSGNPAGRPKGSRNKLSEDFVATLYEDFQQHGTDAITKCRENSPETYVKVIASLLPRDIHIKESPLEDMSDDDIRDALARIAALRTALIGINGTQAHGNPGAEAAGKPH